MLRFRISLLFVPAAFALVLIPADGRAESASIYEKRCASCHGEDGKAATPVGRALKIPSFAGSTFTREQIASLLAKSESHSRLGLTLGDAELEALVAHLNALASTP